MILDLFSRYVVGWMVADGESAHLAQRLIRETCTRQVDPPLAASPSTPTANLDRPPPVALLMADLWGLTKTLTVAPHVSDDNPYCETQFRTAKYRTAEFP